MDIHLFLVVSFTLPIRYSAVSGSCREADTAGAKHKTAVVNKSAMAEI